MVVSDSGDTWQMMVAVVRRAMRMTQPPAEDSKPVQPRRDNVWVEDHYALLLAAGY
jgi:hypothetical protein